MPTASEGSPASSRRLDRSTPTKDAGTEFEINDDLVDLLDGVFLDSVPMAPRLLELLEERGWRGWTTLERVEPPAP